MPRRKIPFFVNGYYHVYNRGINRQPTFTSKHEYDRALLSLKFYVNSHPPVRLSKYLVLKDELKKATDEKINNSAKNVELIAFCLMPNHFHLLVKETLEHGISEYLGNFQNSYAKFFNKRHERDGSLFLDQFKAVQIETDEQILHVLRYIHLNPYTSGLVKSFDKLESYAYSSLIDLLQPMSNNFKSSFVSHFIKTPEAYREFLRNRADYQKALDKIKHLIHE